MKGIGIQNGDGRGFISRWTWENEDGYQSTCCWCNIIETGFAITSVIEEGFARNQGETSQRPPRLAQVPGIHSAQIRKPALLWTHCLQLAICSWRNPRGQDEIGDKERQRWKPVPENRTTLYMLSCDWMTYTIVTGGIQYCSCPIHLITI